MQPGTSTIIAEMKTRWALLIGIDMYPTQPLRGCVNDINLIKDYLEADETPTQVTTFTASRPANPKCQQPVEDQESWPTLLNILSAFDDIISAANPGDLVYVHYSGHGIRLPTPTHLPHGHKNTGDVALVVLSDSAFAREELLHGFSLANILKQMVTAGLFVTISLDCCFSGHVYREDDQENSAIRTVDLAVPQFSASRNHSDAAQQVFRDARPLPRWLVDPEGYNIITACGPHETAQEMALDGKRHGVLSYYLFTSLLLLKRHGSRLSHQTFHENLVTLVHSKSIRQTPTHYGTQKFSFFEGISWDTVSNFMSVSEHSSKQFVLEAGMVHGIHRDDEYAIYPFASSENAFGVSSDPSFMTKVSAVGPLTSILKPFSSIPARSAPENGWKAKALTHSSPRQIHIGLMPSIERKHDWTLASLGRPFFHISEEPSSGIACQFFVDTFQDQHCRILDSDGRYIPGILPIPLESSIGLQPVMDILQHIATFQYMEGIRNPPCMSTLLGKFYLKLENDSGNPYRMDDVLDIAENQDLRLSITNLSDDCTLYVTILNFTPMWQIHCLTGDEGNSGYLTIPPPSQDCTGEEDLMWSMSVPELLRSHRKCEDMIKVIITSHPTSFHSLLLPKITDRFGHDVRGHGLGPHSSPWSQITRESKLSKREDFYIATLKIRTQC